MIADVLMGPTPRGLAEVAAIAKANVRSAVLTGAAIVDDRYALTFRAPPIGNAAREKALEEMEQALNRHHLKSADPTGIELQFA